MSRPRNEMSTILGDIAISTDESKFGNASAEGTGYVATTLPYDSFGPDDSWTMKGGLILSSQH